MTQKSYFGALIDRTEPRGVPKASSTQAPEKKAAEGVHELQPLDHFLFGPVDTSEWGEVEITAATNSRPERETTEPMAKPSTDQPGSRPLSPRKLRPGESKPPETPVPPRPAANGGSKPGIDAISSLESFKASKTEKSVAAPPIFEEEVHDKTGQLPGQSISAKFVSPSQPKSVSVASEQLLKNRKSDAMNLKDETWEPPPPTPRALRPADSVATKLEKTLRETVEVKNQISPEPTRTAGDPIQKDTKVAGPVPPTHTTPPVQRWEDKQIPIQLQPRMQLEAPVRFPEQPGKDEIPRNRSAALLQEGPKLTIGRIEVEVVQPPAKKEPAKARKSAGRLSRDCFGAIGLAQM